MNFALFHTAQTSWKIIQFARRDFNAYNKKEARDADTDMKANNVLEEILMETA